MLVRILLVLLLVGAVLSENAHEEEEGVKKGVRTREDAEKERQKLIHYLNEDVEAPQVRDRDNSRPNNSRPNNSRPNNSRPDNDNDNDSGNIRPTTKRPNKRPTKRPPKRPSKRPNKKPNKKRPNKRPNKRPRPSRELMF